MPELETIQVLGRGTDVSFKIDDTVPFDVAERNLRQYLAGCRNLYSSGTVSVNVGRRILAPEQMSAIRGILDRETGLKVSQYWCPPEVLEQALAGPEAKMALPAPEQDVEAACSASQAQTPTPGEAVPGQQLALFPGESIATPPSGSKESGDERKEQHGATPGHSPAAEELPAEVPPSDFPQPTPVEDSWEGDVGSSYEPVAQPPGTAAGAYVENNQADAPVVVKRTCRSGEVLRANGDIVVYGDVNPGAVVIAGGDIVVLGALRGAAHAGAYGNLNATILALSFEAPRLQIGAHVGEPTGNARKQRDGGRARENQIAYLRRRTIYLAPFTRRLEEYQGGTPYEG